MSRYDWSKARPDTLYMTTDGDGQVLEHTSKPASCVDQCSWWSDKSNFYRHACQDWQDSLEERPKWEPKRDEWVCFIDPRTENGCIWCPFDERSNFDLRMLKRGLIFRTEAEAIAKVKELGWD